MAARPAGRPTDPNTIRTVTELPIRRLSCQTGTEREERRSLRGRSRGRGKVTVAGDRRLPTPQPGATSRAKTHAQRRGSGGRTRVPGRLTPPEAAVVRAGAPFHLSAAVELDADDTTSMMLVYAICCHAPFPVSDLVVITRFCHESRLVADTMTTQPVVVLTQLVGELKSVPLRDTTSELAW